MQLRAPALYPRVVVANSLAPEREENFGKHGEVLVIEGSALVGRWVNRGNHDVSALLHELVHEKVVIWAALQVANVETRLEWGKKRVLFELLWGIANLAEQFCVVIAKIERDTVVFYDVHLLRNEKEVRAFVENGLVGLSKDLLLQRHMATDQIFNCEKNVKEFSYQGVGLGSRSGAEGKRRVW